VLLGNGGGGRWFWTAHSSDTLADGSPRWSFDPPADSLASAPPAEQWLRVSVLSDGLQDGVHLLSAAVDDPASGDPPQELVWRLHVNLLPPPAPLGLAATPALETITLSWAEPDPADEVTGHVLYRGLTPEALDSLAWIPLPGTEWIDGTIPDESAVYWYALRAVDITGAMGPPSEAVASWLDIPAPVTGLQAIPAWPHLHLAWNPVDTTVYGNPLQGLTGYLVYFNEYAYEDSLFSFFQFTADTSCSHPYALRFGDNQFYRVSAYAGPLDALNTAIAARPGFRWGELPALLRGQAAAGVGGTRP
jgi:hypothetical protein